MTTNSSQHLVWTQTRSFSSAVQITWSLITSHAAPNHSSQYSFQNQSARGLIVQPHWCLSWGQFGVVWMPSKLISAILSLGNLILCVCARMWTLNKKSFCWRFVCFRVCLFGMSSGSFDSGLDISNDILNCSANFWSESDWVMGHGIPFCCLFRLQLADSVSAPSPLAPGSPCFVVQYNEWPPLRPQWGALKWYLPEAPPTLAFARARGLQTQLRTARPAHSGPPCLGSEAQTFGRCANFLGVHKISVHCILEQLPAWLIPLIPVRNQRKNYFELYFYFFYFEVV